MKSLRLAAAALVAAISIGGAASAATINLTTNDPRITNDGIYTISAAQADFLGISGATRVAAVGIRSPNGTGYAIGDTFSVTNLMDAVTSGAANVVGWLNGTNANAGYTGAAFAALGTTTINGFDRASDLKLFSVVYVGFKDTFVVRGTNTFGITAATVGDFSSIAPVPVPAALPLLGGGLALFGLLGWRKRRSTAA